MKRTMTTSTRASRRTVSPMQLLRASGGTLTGGNTALLAHRGVGNGYTSFASLPEHRSGTEFGNG